jgi:hypothetical protein
MRFVQMKPDRPAVLARYARNGFDLNNLELGLH